LKNSVSANLISSHNAAPATLNDPAIGGVRHAGPCADGLLGADERCAEQDDRSQCDVELRNSCGAEIGCAAVPTIDSIIPQTQRSVVTQLQLSSAISAGICI
jgi:hypothetical protein